MKVTTRFLSWDLAPTRSRPRLRASAHRFRNGIPLNIDQTARVDFELVVGEVVQEISVTSEGPLLQTESGSVGQVINSVTTEQLPLNGRNFTDLAALSPGVSTGATNFFGDTSNLQINGMRQSKTLFTLGGASITDKHFSGTKLLPPPDAIEQFKIQTNSMQAEFGAGGGVVNVELKSGTNELHGSVYEFLRNEKLDARNFFAQERAILKQNQFGFTLGGPIARNRTFLFGDYQGTRIRRGATTNSPVPSVANRAGDFSGQKTIIDPATRAPFPNNQIPSNRFSPTAEYFLDYFPIPNNGLVYTQNASQTSDSNQFDVRVDHMLSAKDHLSGSYSFQDGDNALPGPYPENGGRYQDFRTQLVTLRETHTFSPNVINQFTGSFYRNFGFTTPQGLGTDHTQLSGIGGFELAAAAFPSFPNMNITGYTALNGGAFMPLRNFQDMKWFGDSVTWIKGAHQLKFGGQARWYRFTAYNAGNSRGNFVFNGTYSGLPFSDYLLGIPFQGQRDFPRELFGGFNQNQFLFAQDDWKVSSKLTLNLGLRYELNHARTPLHNQAATYDFETRRLIVSSDDDGNINTTSQPATQFAYPLYQDLIVTSAAAGLPQSLRFTPNKTFAPRFGLAWQALDGFVVRAGYGIFYGESEGNREGSTQVANPPILLSESAVFNNANSLRTLQNYFAPIAVGALNVNPVNFSDVDPYNEMPYFQQWNVSLEKRIGSGLTVQGAYVGSAGTHIEFSNLLNVPLPGPGGIQGRRPDQRWAVGSDVRNNSNSSYHAFQGKAETRNWKGLTMLGAFTWAKSMDLLSSDPQGSPVQDANNIAAERAVSDFNVRLRGTASVIYDLPFFGNSSGVVKHAFSGWTLSNIIVLQSGTPFTPTIGSDPANTGTSRRPNRLADGSLDDPTIDAWFDKAAFALPAQYTFGNSGRNILFGPDYKNWNLGLFKTFELTEDLRLQFRAEAFNLTNTAQFGQPITNIQAGTAGRILSAGEPREWQFALKLMF